MIPKVVHFYWGNETMSWMRYMTLYSFRKLNPDWQMVLHVVSHCKDRKRWASKETQDSFNFSGADYFSEAKNLPGILVRTDGFKQLSSMSPAQASDIFSWTILAGEGGFYSDMDILFIRPISEFYNNVSSFDAVLGTVRLNVFGIGLMASGGNNLLFKTALETARKLYHPSRYESAGNNVLNRLSGGTALNIAKRFGGLRIHFMDTSIVYRWTHKEISQIFEQTLESPPPTVGIHWFAGHSTAQQYNNLLNAMNYTSYQNTFCKYAAALLGEA